MFCDWNLVEWWVICPFPISHSTSSNFGSSLVIQFLPLNLSFKGWRPWEAWSLVTVLYFSIPIKKRVYKPPAPRSTTLIPSIFLKCQDFLKICLQSISNVNDRQRNVPVSPAQKGTVSARGCCRRSPPSVKRPTVQPLGRWNGTLRSVWWHKSQLSETKILNNLRNFKAPFPECGPLTTFIGITKDTT